MSALRPLVGSSLVAVALAASCTDLSLDGDEQLSCATNDDCPEGLLCAAALGRCVDEAVVAETPIAVDGEATVDALRISRVEGFARTVVTAAFTKPPVGTVTALVDNRLAIPCEADDAGPKVQRCGFDARDFADEVDGFYDVIVVAADAAGNEARARARFELDTVAPGLAPDSVAIVYALVDDAIVRDVSALGPATAVTVQLSLTEATAETPALVLEDAGGSLPLTHDDARSVGPLHVYDIAGIDIDALADGPHGLSLSVVDDVGNAETIALDAVVDIDHTLPEAPVVGTAGAIVFERIPWGTRAAPAPTFRVLGAAGAAEANTTLVVTSGESLNTTLLGVVGVDGDGGFTAALENIDLPRVFVRVVDSAGNIGPAAAVQDIVWTASLGGRRRGDDFSNPHALFLARDFQTFSLEPNLNTEAPRSGDLIDGERIAVDAVPSRVNLRRAATNQPQRMSHAAGYLPTISAPVLFGGVPSLNGSQTTTTFVLRDDVWTQVFNEPPANGPLAYDTVREELVSLLVTGELWSFNGNRWTQLPVADIPTVARGPIAYDPLLERLVTVQGTETWVLGGDEVWTRLDSDAPMPGLATYDGFSSQTPGGVIGFDGVDGHVIMHGEEANGVGAVYALVDDVWTRLGDAPPSVGATAVENLDTGRVHFVGRSERSSFVRTNGTMLTWDGAAMVPGPVHPEPNAGAAATYDLVRHRIILHGGTGDSVPNVQALPQKSLAVQNAGDTEWIVDFQGNAPATIAHNGGGAAHYNPVLNTVVIHGGATSNNLARITTLLTSSGFNVLGTSNGSPLSNILPFFDGLRSRMIEGSQEAFWNGTAWERRTLPFTIFNEPSYTWDEDADTALAFNSAFDGSVETFRLRGDVRTILNPTTSPPGRRAPTMVHDPVHHRTVLVGGNTLNNTGPVPDAWVFEDGDWRQIDDIPLDLTLPNSFLNVGRHQLVFDRARGVVTGFFDGVLYDLVGDSWVQRAINTPPRFNSLMVYDEFEERLLFLGAMDFERPVNTIVAVDVDDTRAAEVVRLNIAAAGAAPDAVLTSLELNATAGGTGADAAGPIDGATLLHWRSTSFVELASNVDAADAPNSLRFISDGDDLGRILDRELILAVAAAPVGSGLTSEVVLEQFELTLTYREP